MYIYIYILLFPLTVYLLIHMLDTSHTLFFMSPCLVVSQNIGFLSFLGRLCSKNEALRHVETHPRQTRKAATSVERHGKQLGLLHFHQLRQFGKQLKKRGHDSNVLHLLNI